MKEQFKKYVKELDFGDDEADIKKAMFSFDMPYEYIGDLVLVDDSILLADNNVKNNNLSIQETEYEDVPFTGPTVNMTNRVGVVTCDFKERSLCKQALAVFLMQNFEKVNYVMLILACTAIGEFSFFRRELINRIVLKSTGFEVTDA